MLAPRFTGAGRPSRLSPGRFGATAPGRTTRRVAGCRAVARLRHGAAGALPFGAAVAGSAVAVLHRQITAPEDAPQTDCRIPAGLAGTRQTVCPTGRRRTNNPDMSRFTTTVDTEPNRNMFQFTTTPTTLRPVTVPAERARHRAGPSLTRTRYARTLPQAPWREYAPRGCSARRAVRAMTVSPHQFPPLASPSSRLRRPTGDPPFQK